MFSSNLLWTLLSVNAVASYPGVEANLSKVLDINWFKFLASCNCTKSSGSNPSCAKDLSITLSNSPLNPWVAAAIKWETKLSLLSSSIESASSLNSFLDLGTNLGSPVLSSTMDLYGDLNSSTLSKVSVKLVELKDVLKNLSVSSLVAGVLAIIFLICFCWSL